MGVEDELGKMLASINNHEFSSLFWGKNQKVWNGLINPNQFVNFQDIQKKLCNGLLKWPYFTLLKDGQASRVETYTRGRDVIGQRIEGFPDFPKIEQLIADGATLKLNNVCDWDSRLKIISSEFQKIFSAAVTTYLFHTPKQSRGMLPHRDAAHVLVLQLEGFKKWSLYSDERQVRSKAGLDIDITTKPNHEIVLEPGDVLYVPHGWPHYAQTVSETSLHATFTLTEPTPEDLLEGFLKVFANKSSDLVLRHHTMSLELKASRVRDTMISNLDSINIDEWIKASLDYMDD